MLMITEKNETTISVFLSKVKQGLKDFADRFHFVKVGDSFDYIFTFYTKHYGYICAHLPSKNLGWFIYASPDSSADTSTFYRGYDKGEASKARIRKGLVSHNWIYKYSNNPHVPKHAVEEMMDSVRQLNDDMESIYEQYNLFGR